MNIFCSKNFTPLIWAVVRNLNNIVKILLKSKKVDPNITDPNGLSLIDLALVHKNNEILEMYTEIVDPTFKWKNFSVEEQAKILAADRSNNYLNTEKLESLYPIRKSNF